MLLTMLLLSLPALVNIAGLFLVILAMYALLGMQLFGEVREGEAIGEEANFCSFPIAMLTLFRCATGEGWNTIMHDAMDEGHGGSWLAVPYFVSFVVLSSFVVLKMLIAVILETYLVALARDANVLQVEHKDAYIEAWGKADPKATGRMPVTCLVDAVHELPPPLGLDPKDFPMRAVSRSSVVVYLLQGDLRCWPPKSGVGPPEVLFTQVLASVMKDSFRHDDKFLSPKLGRKKSNNWTLVLPDEETNLGVKLRERLRKSGITMDDGAEEGMLVSDHLAACMLQGAWRRNRKSGSFIQRKERREQFRQLVFSASPTQSRVARVVGLARSARRRLTQGYDPYGLSGFQL
jgi:hypothetical protein